MYIPVSSHGMRLVVLLIITINKASYNEIMLYLYSLISYKKYMYISSMDIVIGLYQDVIIQALHYYIVWFV